MKKEKINKICLTGVGVASFVVLSLCIQVPVFENYYLCLGYIVFGFFCYFMGTLSSIIVGSLGVVLYCLLINGLRGMPGWVVANIVIAIIVSLVCKSTENMQNKKLRHFIILTSVVVSVAIGILGAKSIVESFLYAQPFALRLAKNIYAFVSDVIVMGISIPICYKLEPIVRKKLKKAR